jgi:hypothetical protein
VILPGVLVFGLGLAATVARIASLVAIAAVGAAVSAAFASRLDRNLADRRLSPQAQAAIGTVRTRPLVTSAYGVPAPERPTVHHALVDASVHAFRIGMESAVALAALGA